MIRKESLLLSRETFKEAVFTRDKHKCVWCGAKAVDAHHLIERKLWDDGGYFLDNGVSLCSQCHLLAETCDISESDLRSAARIQTIHLPLQIRYLLQTDKWGRDLSDIFKYPRTMHLPWSEKLQNDDRLIESLDGFWDYFSVQGTALDPIAQYNIHKGGALRGRREPAEVVVTEKMDGENTSMYRDYIHARSPSPLAPHASRNRIREIHARIKSDIPEGWRVCGENLYAEHSISYSGLPSYFMVFSIWEGDRCLDWDETKEWCGLLDLPTVPELYRGPFFKDSEAKRLSGEVGTDCSHIISLYDSATMWDRCEGYVVRVVRSFRYDEFQRVVAKFVRKNHVQTDKHWMFKPVVPNRLADGVWI